MFDLSASLIAGDTIDFVVYDGYTSGNTPLEATITLGTSAATYTVTYNGNDNTGGSAPVDGSSPYVSGSTVTVPGAGSLVKTNHIFSGWNPLAERQRHQLCRRCHLQHHRRHHPVCPVAADQQRADF